ncbi:ABC transporter ATP-binding protein [Proteinivorax tanatarense]|uniref:ABC transporter ATP-binding protein n=1 Tax=Proteinivorax tanatarense TaxID=1260629 RepID=A0AAU7VQB5_9FIRM
MPFKYLKSMVCKRDFTFITICLVSEIALTLLIAQKFRLLVDSAIDGNYQLFYTNLIALILFTVLIAVCISFRTFTIGKISEKITYYLRKQGTEKLVDLPQSKLDKMHSGDAMSRLSNDLQLVKQFVENDGYFLLLRPLMAVAVFTYLFYLNWQLTLISSAVLPVLYIIMIQLGKPLGNYSKELQSELANINKTTQDTLGGVSVVKSFNLQSIIDKKYRKQVKASIDSGIKLDKRKTVLESLMIGLSFLPQLVTFGVGGYLAVIGYLSAGKLLAFINLLNYLTFPMKLLPGHYASYKSALEGLKRIQKLLDEENERDTGKAFEKENVETLVEVENLTFGYNDSPVLKNLTFSVKKGETVALVGPSGSGKSTVFKLLTGFYSGYYGTIKMFEKDIQSWKLDSLREQIATVSQDTYLFPETIEYNLKVGNEDCSEEEMVKAAINANAHEFIKNEPYWYKTMIKERGENFSGGQKQRLALTRAIVKNPKLMLLDEATSALDTESEAIVQNAISKAMTGRTCIVIAHRLSTIVQADRILVLNEGCIIEEGTHQDLLEQKGLYYDLYYKQFKKKGGVA